MNRLLDWLASIGAWVRGTFAGMGYGARFFFRLLWLSVGALRRPRLVIEQIHFIGNYSLSIILVSGLFVGFVLGLQGYYTLQRYGSGEALGLMKSGEQLVAMEMMAVDPIARVLAPRFLAAIIALPLLAAMFSAVGVMGGYIVGVPLIGVDPGAFWSQTQAGVDVFADVGNGVLKSIVFGFVCAFIALYVGHEAKPTPEGVSRATTTTVVASSLAVLAFDFMLTALMFST